MDKQLDFDYIRFEWDISKNTSNQTKHWNQNRYGQVKIYESVIHLMFLKVTADRRR